MGFRDGEGIRENLDRERLGREQNRSMIEDTVMMIIKDKESNVVAETAPMPTGSVFMRKDKFIIVSPLLHYFHFESAGTPCSLTYFSIQNLGVEREYMG